MAAWEELTLTEDDIRRLASPQIFQRGVDYYTEGRVKSLRCEQSTAGVSILDAIVHGTQPYRVRIELCPDQILPDCSCPYDWEPFCKHAIAVLLAAIYGDVPICAPERTIGQEELEGYLKTLGKDELIALIVEHAPELKKKLRWEIATRQDAQSALEALKHEISQELAEWDFIDYSSVPGFVSQVEPLREKIQTLGQQGQSKEACEATLYFVEALIKIFERGVDDSDGLLGEFVCQLPFQLKDWLPKLEKKERERYLIKILELAWRQDYGLDFEGAAVEACPLEDWPFLETYLKERRSQAQGYERVMLRDLLLDGYDKFGQQALFLALLENHLEYSDDYLHLADKYVELGRSEDAITLLEEGLWQDDIAGMDRAAAYEKLIALHLQAGDYAKALEAGQTLFREFPRQKSYQHVKAFAKSKDWEKLRKEFLSLLWRKQQAWELAEIYLGEGDLASVVQVADELKADVYLLERIVSAVAASYPKAAVRYYQKLVEHHVGQSQRSHYRQAAYYARRIKELLLKQSKKAVWEKYIASLKKAYSKRRALLEELSPL